MTDRPTHSPHPPLFALARRLSGYAVARQIVLVIVGCLLLVYGAERVVHAGSPSTHATVNEAPPTPADVPTCVQEDDVRDAVEAAVRVTLTTVGNGLALWYGRH